MNRCSCLWFYGLVWLALGAEAVAADVVLENRAFRAVLGGDAVWRSLVEKTSGEECCLTGRPVRFADARVDGKTCRANQAVLEGSQLVLGLEGCDTELVYDVAATDDWIAFRLVEISGTRPSHVTLVRLGAALTEHVGARMGSAWNDRLAVCLRSVNGKTDGRATGRGDHAELVTNTQDFPGPKLEGAGAALIVCPTPRLRSVVRELSVASDLVRNEQDGVPSKDLEIARQSYWFLSFAESKVDQVIACCRRTGIRQVMLNSGAWCTSPGHYTFNTSRYPDGIESLRRTVGRLNDHGILVGMHCFASKISKRDPYVTPVPDRRFWVDMSATLAEDVGPDDVEIRTIEDLSQWPGSPVSRRKVWEGGVDKHQEVIIDDEIIRYESIGPEGRWDTFLGCRRGAWGTKAAAHQARTAGRHYGVDGCINGYIIDQDTSLFQETTDRLAHVFNTCGFEMVYFDGSEDVDRRRYNYYLSNFHGVAMSKFTKRPIIHMGGGLTHQLWHSFTRSATIDQYPGTYLAYVHAGGTIEHWPTCKDHIDRSVARVIRCHDDMIPGELGWFGIGPKSGQYDGLQYDEIEYLMCKSLAYDAPISLQTSFARMESHPLTADILEIVRVYETIRLARKVPQETLTRLRAQGKDFVMLPSDDGDEEAAPRFVEVEAVEEVAGTHDVRAFVGPDGDDTIATLWHYVGKEGKVLLDPCNATAWDVRGTSVEIETPGDRMAVPVDRRRLTLRFRGTAPSAVRDLLAGAALELRKPDLFWIRADEYRDCVGTMTKGSQAGIDDPEALGDVVLCSGPIDRSGKTPCYVEYRVQIPREADYTLWARVLYPRGGDMSFGIVRPGDEVTLTGRQVLGNCGANDARWHWTGRGGGVTTVPPGSPVVFHLQPGEFIFRIYPREGSGTAKSNPRLDCLCLSEDPDYVPTDADARAAFAGR